MWGLGPKLLEGGCIGTSIGVIKGYTLGQKLILVNPDLILNGLWD